MHDIHQRFALLPAATRDRGAPRLHHRRLIAVAASSLASRTVVPSASVPSCCRAASLCSEMRSPRTQKGAKCSAAAAGEKVQVHSRDGHAFPLVESQNATFPEFCFPKTGAFARSSFLLPVVAAEHLHFFVFFFFFR